MSLVVPILIVFWGATVLWSNPRRVINVLACSLSLHVAIWVTIRQFATMSTHALPWVRLAIAIGDLIPAHLQVFMYSVAYSPQAKGIGFQVARSWGWIAIGLVLGIVAFSRWFIPLDSPPGSLRIGPLYIFHFIVLIILYFILIYQARRISKDIHGIERLELNLILVGGGIAAIVVLGLMLATRLLRADISPQAQPLVILVLFSALCLLITTNKIFDARYIFVISSRLLLVVLGISVVAYLGEAILRPLVGGGIAAVVVALIAVALHRPFNGFCSRILNISAKVSDLRRAVLEIAQSTMDASNLNMGYRRTLQAWSQAQLIEIYALGSKDRWDRQRGIGKLGAVEDILRKRRWLSQEQLTRERPSASIDLSLQALRDNGIAAAVCCPGSVTCLIICMGERPSRRPYTYPELQLLLEIATIMETSYTRCSLMERSHEAERLATVGVLGAGVAHEIRNPLVTIKTFVQLLPKQHENPEFRGRFFELIGKEISRIEGLTEQLLDLAAPRKYTMEAHSLHALLGEVLELLKIRAREFAVVITDTLSAETDRVITDGDAVRQVMINLCLNAIQAQEGQNRERWIKISTTLTERGVELSVSDNGSGIPEDSRVRLFQTFQTTKSSGMGLGLVICGQILRSIGASISVDPHVHGRGATFRIVFPCHQNF